jgi:hypothetical protein
MDSNGDLRVWWIPQVPGKPFYVSVKTLIEAKLILNTLAYYDLFQLEHRIKPDYCNIGGLQVFDSSDNTDSENGSWVDWYEEDTCDDIDVFELEELRQKECK